MQVDLILFMFQKCQSRNTFNTIDKAHDRSSHASRNVVYCSLRNEPMRVDSCINQWHQTDELVCFFSVDDKPASTDGPPLQTPPLSPLYIAMLCVGIPLFIVGVLAGAKRVYAKLWVPEGFPRRPRRQPSTRREPVGQEVSMR